METIKRSGLFFSFALCLDFLSPVYGQAQFDGETARYWSSLSRSSSRALYEEKLITEILEKSKDKYGDYQLEIVHTPMTSERGYRELKLGTLINFQTNPITRPLNADEIQVLPHGLMKGIMGYRRCITRRGDLPRFESVKTAEDLRNFKIGQVANWTDSDIFKANGYPVYEGPDLDAMFLMLSRGRFDCFPLGISEVEEELSRIATLYPDLVAVPDLVLHYPLPVRLQVRKESSQLIERLEYGLERMLKDGSFDKLFNTYFGDVVKRLKSPKTRQIDLSNPFLERHNPAQ